MVNTSECHISESQEVVKCCKCLRVLQSKMGALFKPMLPLTHLHDQESSIKICKPPPHSYPDAAPQPESSNSDPLLTNGEAV